MRSIRFVLLPLISAAAFAQIVGISGSGGAFSPGNVQLHPRSDPPSSPLPQLFGSATYRTKNGTDGRTFVSRYLSDQVRHIYVGYEMLIEPQQPGMYLVTIGELGTSPLEMSIEMASRMSPRVRALFPPQNNAPWTHQPLPSIPQPLIFHDGDTISVELFADPATGDKLFDDVLISRFTPVTRGLPPRPSFQPIPPAAPTVSGEARDYSAADGEFQIVQPLVSVNGNDDSALRTPHAARGSLVWIYIPRHGRYILSLAPRPQLDFKKAGEVRGGVIAFQVGENSVKITCANSITTGDAAYHLYVLLDPEWEPTVAAQKALVSIGSVGVGELLALKK